jgi:hypothetical protein
VLVDDEEAVLALHEPPAPEAPAMAVMVEAKGAKAA